LDERICQHWCGIANVGSFFEKKWVTQQLKIKRSGRLYNRGQKDDKKSGIQQDVGVMEVLSKKHGKSRRRERERRGTLGGKSGCVNGR